MKEARAMANTPIIRQRRQDKRTLCRAGQMPSNWDAMTPAQKMQFTQTERAELKAQEFMWAPDAPEHGTLNGYNNHYCRCPNCSQANTDQKYSYRNGGGYQSAVPFPVNSITTD
jgi:hypothetical protein